MKKLFTLSMLICLILLALPLQTFATDSTEIYITNAWARPVGGMMGDMDMDMGDDDSMDMTAEPDMDMGDDDSMDMTAEPDMDMDEMSMPNFGVSAIYMDVENIGEQDVQLVSVESAIAEFIEIHQTNVVDDVMQMRHLEDGVTIASDETVNFAPAGLHIMMINLYRALEVDSALAVTLNFVVLDDDGELTDETFSVILGVPVLEFAPENDGDIVPVNGWVRATGNGDMMDMDMDMGDDDAESDDMSIMIPPSAMYMTLVNRGEDDDRLIGVETPASNIAEIHETSVVDDVMQMREVGVIELPAGESAILQQGGLHVMLPELGDNLFVGNAITVTLTFDSGREMVVAVPVLDFPPELMIDMDE